MNVVNVVLTEQYGADVYTPAMKSHVSTAALVGAIAGQLVFGLLADRLGRRVTMITTCVILIVGGILCTFAYGGSPAGTIWVLVVARGILGFGIGDEHPLSASSSAEDTTSVANRNQRVALTFSLQGLGSLAAAICGDVLVHEFAPASNGKNDKQDLETIWRALFGIGVVPALVVVFFRYQAKEPETFLAAIRKHNKRKRSQDMDSTLRRRRCVSSCMQQIQRVLYHYGGRLFGTAATSFLFYIVFYAQNLFSATMLSVVGLENPSLKEVTRQNVYVALLALPGYYVAVASINKIGRKRMQVQGFAAMTVIFLVLGTWWVDIQQHTTSFIVLYGLSLFFTNFGPNTSTYILPTEMFPTAIRGSCHGFSAAMGRLGAAIGSYGFSPLVILPGFGYRGVFYAFAALCVLSIPITLVFTFDNADSLDAMDEEYEANIVSSETLIDAARRQELDDEAIRTRRHTNERDDDGNNDEETLLSPTSPAQTTFDQRYGG
ncbi:Inorganic phosphate transporter, partial [Globisporangium splendens]